MRERVAALGEALRVAPESDRDAIALALFELACAIRAGGSDAAGPIELIARLPGRSRRKAAGSAMRAIIRSWSSVPRHLHPLVPGLSRSAWHEAARAAGDEPDAVSRQNLARFIEDTADVGLAGIVCELLHDEHQRVRLHADRTLLRLSLTLLDHVSDDALGPELSEIARRPAARFRVDPAVLEIERTELCRRLADAAWRFADHRCRAPLLGSLLVLDRVTGGALERPVAERIRRLLRERAHPSHAPLRTVLRRTPSPLLRERAFRWLVLDSVETTCVDRLSSADSLVEHAVTLRRSALALRPKRGDRLRKVRPVGGDTSPIPSATELKSLDERSRRGFVRFAELIGLDPSTRRAVLEPTLADEDPVVRLLGAHSAHPTDLGDFVFDADPAIASSAAIRWSSLGVSAPALGSASWAHRARLASLLRRSPHESVRSLARHELDRLDPFGADRPANRVAARLILDRDPVGFVRLVRERIADPEQVLSALMLVRGLRVESRFEMDLVELATASGDSRVRATAIAALGAVRSTASIRVVQSALRETDQRVRSNAIEAVPRDPGVLLEHKDDGSARVRATALRRMLAAGVRSEDGSRAAASSLAGMLKDDRADHRLSGAWAAERVVTPQRRGMLGSSWRTLVSRVVDAAENDPDHRVRRRATRCATRLDQAAKAGIS